MPNFMNQSNSYYNFANIPKACPFCKIKSKQRLTFDHNMISILCYSCNQEYRINVLITDDPIIFKTALDKKLNNIAALLNSIY